MGALITHERQASADNENMHRLPSLARSRLQRQNMIKSAKVESVAVTVELGCQRQGLLVLAVHARTQKSVHPCQRLVHARVPFRPTLLCCLLGRRDHPLGAAAAGLGNIISLPLPAAARPDSALSEETVGTAMEQAARLSATAVLSCFDAQRRNAPHNGFARRTSHPQSRRSAH